MIKVMEPEVFESEEPRKPPRGKLLIYIVGGVLIFAAANALAFSDGYRNFVSKARGVLTGGLSDAVGQNNFKLADTIDLSGNQAEADAKPKTSPKTGESQAANIENKITSLANKAEEKIAATSAAIKGEAEKIFATSLPAIISESTTTPLPQTQNENTPLQNNPAVGPQQTALLKPILIYIVQISGNEKNTTNQDLISLFNPNWESVDISGWQIVRKTASGKTTDTFSPFPGGSIITSKGKFVWANESFSQADANFRTKDYLAKDNSIALFKGSYKTAEIVDSVAWGDGLINPYIEGTAAPNPKSFLERKLGQDSMPIDTGNNFADFEVR